MDDALLGMVRSYFSASREVERYQERAANGLLAWEQHVADRYLRPAGILLDIGCGAGREAIALCDLGHQVTGLDISAPQVEAARATAHQLGKRIEFHVGNGVDLPFPDSSFRYAVIWGQALGNIPGKHNRTRLVAECARVLVPAGILVFSVHNEEACAPLARERQLICQPEGVSLEDGDYLLKDDPLSDARCFWHYFRRGEILALCEDAGLRALECALARDLGQGGWDTVWVSVSAKG